MAKFESVTYGPGGFDPEKPNGNIVSVEEFEVPDEVADRDALKAELAAAAEKGAPPSAEDFAKLVKLVIDS